MNMPTITTPFGITLSYDKYGNGPALVLVHGSFSDHRSNWTCIKPILEQKFTVYAVARRGRGLTDATKGHSLEDEASDVVALIEAIDGPVFVLGHSYGALVALMAVADVPGRAQKLVLYEPPLPETLTKQTLARLEELAEQALWDDLASTFFHEVIGVPMEEIDALRRTEHWGPISKDAEPTWEELRSITTRDFRADRFADLQLPVLLQCGTESPGELFATEALAAVLPDVRVDRLVGQAHEAMTTAPEQYAESVTRFLLT